MYQSVFYLCNKIPQKINLHRRNIYSSSQFQSLQSMVIWPSYFGTVMPQYIMVVEASSKIGLFMVWYSGSKKQDRKGPVL